MPIKLINPPSSSSKPLVITFRSHHHAYEDESTATIIRHTPPTSPVYSVLQNIYAFILMHYFLWFIPMLVVLYIPFHYGYWWVSLILLSIYIPSFTNKDELNYGRVWQGLRLSRVWRLLQHYVQLEVVREGGGVEDGRKYIIGYHPHGILILSRTVTYNGVHEMMFPGSENRVLGASPMFYQPGSREICLWTGAVRADRKTANKLLQTDNINNLLVYPGGSDEIFLTNPNSKETTLIARKGFIRLAIQHGADLIPAFVFGEKVFYKKMDIPSSIRSFFLRKLRMPLLIFWGKYFTWMPLRGKDRFLSVVYGEPIRVEKAEEPSEEEVDRVYEEFYGRIRGLFEKYKGVYGYGDGERLVIREKKEKTQVKNQMKKGD